MIPDKVKTKSPQAPWRDPVKPVLSKKNKKNEKMSIFHDKTPQNEQ